MEPGTTSMFHRGKVVISEVSNILQFPSPSPKEAPRLSLCKGSAQLNPPPKFTIPVDRFCSENIEETFSIFQKKKHMRIPCESSLFNRNAEDTEKKFTCQQFHLKLKISFGLISLPEKISSQINALEYSTVLSRS